MGIKMLYMLSVFTILMSSPARAQMPHIMKCRGNLNLFCLARDQWKELKNRYGGYNISQSDCYSFRIGNQSKSPFLEFNPWMGIQYKEFPGNYKNSFKVSFKKQDEENFLISMSPQSRRLKQSLNCTISLDLTKADSK